ncbi:MAG: glycosyltransferase family 39 protein [Bacteroidales bacterium]|nr:glycosyltransferase family 39 protein [Bacteroidales bacterium]
MEKINYSKVLVWLIVISLLIRTLLAILLEFGNDEVYYFQYALYPSFSYFDHPPMVGWLMRLFSLNLLLTDEWALRLTSLLTGTLNTWLIFVLGKELHGARAGFYAALLYTASFYTFIIAGTFILPDSPQSLFWLLGMLAFIRSIGKSEAEANTRRWLLLAGLFTGMAMLSKYTAIFLWMGAGLYVLLFARNWLRVKELYFSILLTLIIFLPVLIWNYRNGWVSFGFHGGRVDVTQGGIHPEYFLREIGGQLFYNNPFNVVAGWVAMIALMRGHNYIDQGKARLILLFSLPLILIFPVVSFWRETLPHWSGPGYYGAMLLAAAWLASKNSIKIPNLIKLALALALIVFVAGMGQIKGGWIIKPGDGDGFFRGKKDFSLDMYGWRQVARKAVPLMDSLEKQGILKKGAAMVSFRWFPAANLDYYVARPSGRKLLACGPLHRIHHYQWINHKRGGLQPGEDAWYLVPGRDYRKPEDVCPGCWEEVIPVDTLPVLRGRDTVMYFFLYGMKGFKPCESFPAPQAN